MPTVELATLPLPDFGLPTAVPAIPAATYADRLDAARASVYQAAWLMEQGRDATKYVSGVKAHALETVILGWAGE